MEKGHNYYECQVNIGWMIIGQVTQIVMDLAGAAQLLEKVILHYYAMHASLQGYVGHEYTHALVLVMQHCLQLQKVVQRLPYQPDRLRHPCLGS